jgi:hypothetical protein
MSDLLNLNSANGKSRPRTILRVTHRVGRAAFAALLFCSLLVATPAGGRGAQPGLELTPPHVPVPPSYFGMNILFHPLNMKYVPWPSVPLGGWRTSHVAWSDLEPERGRWNWDLLDKYVSMSQQHHLEILMPLAYTPRWASSTPDAATDVQQGNPPGLSGMPREMEDWRTFVRTIATRYKGRIRNWEIWNEPNRPQSWTGTVDQMVDLTREAAAILKQIDPGSTVVSPAATTPYGLKFFEAFLSKGGGQYVDVIGYHFYVINQPPEGMTALIASVEKIAAKYGMSDKPLWDTEAGFLGDPMFPPSQQAAYLARSYILQWAAGVTRFYWFAWEDHHGTQIWLVEKDNGTLTPAGTALATVQTWMTGAVLTRCAADGSEVWTCDLTRGSTTSHLAWSARGDTALPIPKAWQAHEISALDGHKSAVTGGSIPIGEQHVLIQ